MSAILLAMLLAVPDPPVVDSVVVCPPDFVEALGPWLAHRKGQGHHCRLVSATGSAEEIRAAIRLAAQSGALKHVVLVGDADSPPRVGSLRQPATPTHRAAAKVNVRWGSEPEIATDNWYADLDDDQIPDLAIGRLSADTPEQLQIIVQKILRYERTLHMGLWRRRINVVAGVGGFGALADTVLETATKKFLKDGVPPEYSLSMTYGSWRSPYCPDPRQFHQTVVDRLNEGCLFWVYIGHGQRRYLDRVRVPGRAYHILDTDDVPKLQCGSAAPIAVFLACYTGAFDEPRDCLAEEMLRAARGPVAILSGSRVTMPYAMAVMGNELMVECFEHRRETLGEVVLHAKRRMAAPVDPTAEPGSNRALLDAIAQAISPAPDLLDEERSEHLLLFNLLGDPLLRLQHPDMIPVEVPNEIRAGGQLAVSFHSELAGIGTIELVCRRDRSRISPPRRPSFDPADEALAEYSRVYAQTNDRRWAANTIRCSIGETNTVLGRAQKCSRTVLPARVRRG